MDDISVSIISALFSHQEIFEFSRPKSTVEYASRISTVFAYNFKTLLLQSEPEMARVGFGWNWFHWFCWRFLHYVHNW